MAEALREGGLYNVGTLQNPRWVDADGKETAAPSAKESGDNGSGTLDGVQFASDEARKAAEEAGLTAAEFEGAKATGADGGYTKPDVRALIEAKG